MKQQVYFFLLLLFGFTLNAQRKISGNFLPVKDYSYVFLYKAKQNKLEYVKSSSLDSLGRFEIKLDTTLTAGMYRIVYAIPSEENNFEFIYDGKTSVDFNFSTNDGLTFTKSSNNILWNSYLKSIKKIKKTIDDFYNESTLVDENKYLSIFKELQKIQSNYQKVSDGKLVSVFINSSKPYIPKSYEILETYKLHEKKTNLKHIDFNNRLIKSSSFLSERIINYVFETKNLINNEVYKKSIDDISSAIPNNLLITKSHIFEQLWQRFVDAKNEILANYITSRYLLDLAKKVKNTVLVKRITTYRNTSVGSKAPNFKITSNTKNTNLYSLNDYPYYLLVFWSSDCVHCLNELPKLKAIIAKKHSLKVIAFGLEKDKNQWEKEIKKYPNFMHTIGFEKWNHPIVETYNVRATPTYFLMNTDKVIISKPYGIDMVKEAVNKLENNICKH